MIICEKVVNMKNSFFRLFKIAVCIELIASLFIVPLTNLVYASSSTLPLNGDFETDDVWTPGTEITDWTLEDQTVWAGNMEIDQQMYIVDSARASYTGEKSVESWLWFWDKEIQGVGPERTVQVLWSTEADASTFTHVTVWFDEVLWSPSVEPFMWEIGVEFKDGSNHAWVSCARCRWYGGGNPLNENWDYYDEIADGADGKPWKRYTVEIPSSMDKSHLTVGVYHLWNTWDGYGCWSWVHFDNVFFFIYFLYSLIKSCFFDFITYLFD